MIVYLFALEVLLHASMYTQGIMVFSLFCFHSRLHHCYNVNYLIFSNVILHIPCEHKVPYLWDVLEHHRKLKNFDPRALEIQKISTKQSQLNNTYRGKLMFHQFSTKMAVLMSVLATSDLFHIFTPLIKFYRFNYHVLKGTDVLKIWFIKTWVGFCLNTRKGFLLEDSF